MKKYYCFLLINIYPSMETIKSHYLMAMIPFFTIPIECNKDFLQDSLSNTTNLIKNTINAISFQEQSKSIIENNRILSNNIIEQFIKYNGEIIPLNTLNIKFKNKINTSYFDFLLYFLLTINGIRILPSVLGFCSYLYESRVKQPNFVTNFYNFILYESGLINIILMAPPLIITNSYPKKPYNFPMDSINRTFIPFLIIEFVSYFIFLLNIINKKSFYNLYNIQLITQLLMAVIFL